MMTLQLAGHLGCDKHKDPVHYSELLKLAKRNLERYCSIIIMERMAESVELLARQLKWSWRPDNSTLLDQYTATHSRNSSEPLKVEEGTALYTKRAGLNELDLELYDYAVARFNEKLRLHGIDVKQFT